MEVKEAVEALVSLSSSSSSSSQHLLPCLQKLEDALMKMGPSQSKDGENVLGCAIQALARKKLLNHRDPRVRVSMASCFCHILRIMTLDVPCGSDELLKEVLKLVVSAFNSISDMSSSLYHKRIAVLRTFEKARLFLLMVDRDCDELIVGMFKCFLRNISVTQPDAVFSSMGSIMILTILKMKCVPFQLTLNLLQTLRNGDKAVSPVAQKLAERVLENCDLKLAPRMSEAVQHLGFPLDDYSRAVVHVCSRQFESRVPTEVLGSEDDASDDNVCINRTKALKLNLDTNGYLPPMKSIECNADTRRGCRKSGSSNKSCEESVRIVVKIRNDSSAKLVTEAANAADEEQRTSNAGDTAKVARFDPDGSTFKIRFLEKLGDVRDKEKHAPVRDHTNGRIAEWSKEAANNSLDMHKGRSRASEDGSKAKAIANFPSTQARTSSKKKARISRSPEDLPLSALLHQNSKAARSIGRRQPRSVGAELPGPKA